MAFVIACFMVLFTALKICAAVGKEKTERENGGHFAAAIL